MCLAQCLKHCSKMCGMKAIQAQEGMVCDQQGSLSASQRFGPAPEPHTEMARRIPLVATSNGRARIIT